MPDVPMTIHFVWVGGPIPDKYVENIKHWMAKNPDYTAKLWIDTAATAPEKIAEAISKATIPNIVMCNLNRPSDDKKDQWLSPSPLLSFYQDEVTGKDANYAAACDLIRLKILGDEGGIYIDVDTLPGEEPLGKIVLDEKTGFRKPPGATNDVLAALPNSPFIAKVKESAINSYKKVYFSAPQETAMENIDLHRSKRPWKDRTETTLDWAGPNAYLKVLSELLDQYEDKENQRKLLQEVMPDRFSKKFITHSDQNWRDKGPQNLKEKNNYFREEILFRIKNQCIAELNGIISELRKEKENTETIQYLEKLRIKLQNSSETLPIKDIFTSWQNQDKPGQIPHQVLELEALATSMSLRLDELNFSDETVDNLRAALIPKSRFYSISSGESLLEKAFRGTYDANTTLKQAHDAFFSRIPPPSFLSRAMKTIAGFLSSLVPSFNNADESIKKPTESPQKPALSTTGTLLNILCASSPSPTQANNSVEQQEDKKHHAAPDSSAPTLVSPAADEDVKDLGKEKEEEENADKIGPGFGR